MPFPTFRRKGSTKGQRKEEQKDQLLFLKESTQVGCVSRDSYSRKSILREPGRLGSKHAVKFSKGTLAPNKNSGKKGSIASNYPKV